MLTCTDKGTLFIIDINAQLEAWLREQYASNDQQIMVIQSFGAWITHPFGCLMRNVIVSIYEKDIKQIHLIAKKKENVEPVISRNIIDRLREDGITEEVIQTVEYLPYVDGKLSQWLGGMSCKEENVKRGVDVIRRHPLIPERIKVEGWLFDEHLSKLEPIS